jgi:aminopeptidase N
VRNFIDGAGGLKELLAMVSFRWFGFSILLLTGTLALTARAEAPFSFASTPGQLPKTVVPRHYRIRLQPDLEKFTTRGTVVVDVEVLKPVTEIVLNALDMEITKATLSGKKELALASRLDAQKQTLTLTPPCEIKPGKYRLALDFSGRIGERAEGLFYVKYSTPAGRKVMLGTQMEPTDARRMFPCWDEPVFRATFELTAVLPAKHLGISNMPIERETVLPSGLKEVKFGRSPAMASYLVVLVSGELEELKGKADGVELRIITTEGKKEQARYALETAQKLLHYYNQYFGIKYPLPKLDLMAIPGGFTGAMENWGGITFNERHLLFDPQSTAPETKQRIFGIIAHEMAHQWFGDLVTMAWWDNLWLNEGFASWMGVKATDHFNPDWQVPLAASLDKTGVMSDDARSTTHPIQKPVLNESQANDAFDQITYHKGHAFLHMLETYLGEETFEKGIHRYLKQHRYSNSTTADLWAALGEVSGKPVQAISIGWTEQPGLPLVKVKTECVNGKQMVTLEQERFTVLDPQAKPLEWEIPISVASPSGNLMLLLQEKSTSFPLGDCQKYILANAGNQGYYRVWYESQLFEKLVQNVNELPEIERLKLLNDGWAMVEANRASAEGYFALVDALHDEKNWAVWSQIITVLELVDQLEQGNAGPRKAFRHYACQLLRPQLDRLGWQGPGAEPITNKLLRNRVITALGQFGDESVIAKSRELFASSSLTGDLKTSVLGIVGRYSDKQTYDQLHDMARKAKGTEDRQICYSAMAAALDLELAKETLAISLTDETVPQEATRLVSEVATLGEQKELAWEFAKAHMPQLLNRVEAFRRNGYVASILGAFSDEVHADELVQYVREHISEDAVPKARETAAAIRLKAALKQRELPSVDKWVARRAQIASSLDIRTTGSPRP